MHSKYAPTEKSNVNLKMGYLIEECGEVIAVTGKIMRWGFDSVNPELPPQERETNRDWLKRELADLKYAISLVEAEVKAIEGK